MGNSEASLLGDWIVSNHDRSQSTKALCLLMRTQNNPLQFPFGWLLCQKGIASCKGVVIHYFYRTFSSFFSLASFKFFAPCYKKRTTMESKHSLTVVSQKRKTWTPILTKRWIFIYLFIFSFITASLIIGLQDGTVGIEQHETRVAGHFPATWPCHCP